MLVCATELYVELVGANARALIVSEVDDTIAAMSRGLHG
jgi:hypothetical protein